MSTSRISRSEPRFLAWSRRSRGHVLRVFPSLHSLMIHPHLYHDDAMTRLSTLSNIPPPSLHELLLWVLTHLLFVSYGLGPHPATSVCSAVPSLHCYLVHMDGLQDHFLSHSESFSARRLLYMCSIDRRLSLLVPRHPCSRSLAFTNAAYGCGFTYSCATYPIKHAAATKTNSTTRGVLFRLGGFLNPKLSLCAGLLSYSAYFCRQSTTRISFSQPSASWPSHSHTTSWAHLALSLEKLSVLPGGIPLSKLVLQQFWVCRVVLGNDGFFSVRGLLTIDRR